VTTGVGQRKSAFGLAEAAATNLEVEERQAMAFTVVVEHKDGRVLVCPVGELDLATGPVLERVLESLVGGPPAIELDLTGITFVDCAGLRPIRQARRRASRSFTQVRLSEAQPKVQRVLQLAGLDEPSAAVAR
jgi:anti-anti-sigma factor